jgi:glycosyltransferase involved in cell wall biosynthesis
VRRASAVHSPRRCVRTLIPMTETTDAPGGQQPTTAERPEGMGATGKETSEVWLVVPLYNEEAVIGDVIRETRKTFPNIVCVDDGSTDDSAARARSAGAIVVHHPVNLGQGAALQTGFEYALSVPGMKYVVTFDADGQHQVADVLDMLDRMRQGDVKVVFGSRFLDDRTQASALKKLVLRMAVAYTNLTTQTRLSDAHNGLRVLDREVVSRLDITQNRMAHASELVAQIGSMRIDGAKVPYAEVPVHILYTDYSKSKGQSLWNSVNILAELFLR